MTNETIETLLTLVAVLGSTFAYLEKRNKKYDNFEEKYFMKVLNPYVVSWKKNKELDTIKFIDKYLKKSNKSNEIYIPKYIFYLVEKEKDKEKLHKVLITDYIQNYPNLNNEKGKITNSIFSYFNFIAELAMCLVISLLFMVVSIFFGQLVSGIISNSSMDLIAKYFLILIGAIIFIGILAVLLIKTKKSELDYYSIKQEKIKKYIEEKVKYYDDQNTNDFKYYI